MPYALLEQPERGLLVTFEDPLATADLVGAARDSVARFEDEPRRYAIWDFTGACGFEPSIEELHEIARVHHAAPPRVEGYRHGLVGSRTPLEFLRDDYVLILEFLTGAAPRQLPTIDVFDTLDEARRGLA